MKNIFSILALTMLFASCNKNNTNSTNPVTNPAFIVEGISDINIKNGTITPATLAIKVTYLDSVQDKVSLALSQFPAGITLDTMHWSKMGIPTFYATCLIYDSSDAGSTVGTYPITLTVTNSAGSNRYYTFNLNINNAINCSSDITGTYNYCQTCSSLYYTEVITADTSIINKVWFSNFDNLGNPAYGFIRCATNSIHIPFQTLGGKTFFGFANYSNHIITFNSLVIDGTLSSCFMSLR